MMEMDTTSIPRDLTSAQSLFRDALSIAGKWEKALWSPANKHHDLFSPQSWIRDHPQSQRPLCYSPGDPVRWHIDFEDQKPKTSYCARMASQYHGFYPDTAM